MARLLRILAATAVLAAAAFALHAAVWVPYRQEIRKKQIDTDLALIYERSGGSQPSFSDVVKLRENIAWLNNALRYAPTDPWLHLQLAGSYILIGRPEDAIAQCRVGLRHHQRPEFYRALGDAQIDAAKVDEAVTSYAHVVAFYPHELVMMPEAIRAQIGERIRELYGEGVARQLPVKR